jgi:hypothetical protein
VFSPNFKISTIIQNLVTSHLKNPTSKVSSKTVASKLKILLTNSNLVLFQSTQSKFMLDQCMFQLDLLIWAPSFGVILLQGRRVKLAFQLNGSDTRCPHSV